MLSRNSSSFLSISSTEVIQTHDTSHKSAIKYTQLRCLFKYYKGMNATLDLSDRQVFLLSTVCKCANTDSKKTAHKCMQKPLHRNSPPLRQFARVKPNKTKVRPESASMPAVGVMQPTEVKNVFTFLSFLKIFFQRRRQSMRT